MGEALRIMSDKDNKDILRELRRITKLLGLILEELETANSLPK
jgi:hypothetical protein